MIKPNISFDRFLSTFMPGGVLVVGIWYLHRPFLLKYFPYVASEVGEGGANVGIKTLIFIVAATCSGVIINHFADLAIVALVIDGAENEKSDRILRKLFRLIFRIFSIKVEPDPRIKAVNRYLDSDRKEVFLEMMKDWSWTNENKLQLPNEAISSHQHLMTRLNTLSDRSRSIVQETYMHDVLFPTSLFTVLSFLFPVSLLSFLTTSLSASEEIKVHPYPILISLSVIIYFLGVISAYSVKRRFRHFCSHLITIALHSYDIDTIKETNRK